MLVVPNCYSFDSRLLGNRVAIRLLVLKSMWNALSWLAQHVYIPCREITEQKTETQ